MKRSFLLSLTLFLLTACDQPSGAPGGFDQGDVGKQLSNLLDGVMKNPNLPLEEVKKLHQFEYQVLTLPAASSSEAIEGALDELGKNRWDCFHVEKQVRVTETGGKERTLVFFCKRSRETPLRYLKGAW